MTNIKDTKEQNQFWSLRYKEARTGWDIGYPSTPIKSYIDQLPNKEINILIPGAGNAYEAEYLFKNGFEQVHILDIATAPLEASKQRVYTFPAHLLVWGNFYCSKRIKKCFFFAPGSNSYVGARVQQCYIQKYVTLFMKCVFCAWSKLFSVFLCEAAGSPYSNLSLGDSF